MSPPHDQLHKDLLRKMLFDFLLAFAPSVASEVDESSLTFEQQSFGDVEEGRQSEVDLLAKFQLKAGKNGPPRFVIIHIEHGISENETQFPEPIRKALEHFNYHQLFEVFAALHRDPSTLAEAIDEIS